MRSRILKCEFFNTTTWQTFGYIYAEPYCGEDFCDRCGSCLDCQYCYPCQDGYSDHYWVRYVRSSEEAEKIAEEYEAELIRDNDKEDSNV